MRKLKIALLAVGLIGLAIIAISATEMLIEAPEEGTIMHAVCEAMAYGGCILAGAPLAAYLAFEFDEEGEKK